MFHKSRKTVQYACLSLVIFIPFISYLNNLRQAYGIKGFHIADIAGGWFIGKLYAGYELTLGRLEEPVKLVDSIKGGFWSMSVFDVKVSDPLAGIGHLLATKEFYLPLAIAVLVPLVFTIIFGRAFCGWICPVNTVAGWVDGLRERLKKRFPRIKDSDMGLGTKYWILFFSAVVIAITGVPLFAYYLPYIVFGREVYNLFFQALSAGTLFLFGLVFMELFISRRGWCRYLCPSGALLSIIGSRSMLSMQKKTDASCPDHCRECNAVCPMGLNVIDGKPGGECSQCGECMTSCPNGNFKFVFHPKRFAYYGIAVLFLIAILFAAPANAHHISGLPHYGYAENYPQVPLTEQRIETGDFMVSLTTVFFQGIKPELSDIPYDTQFYIHISNREMIGKSTDTRFKNPFDPDAKKTGSDDTAREASYKGKQVLIISDKKNGEVGRYSVNASSEEAIYRFRHYFKRPGKYTIRVLFFPDKKIETATFQVKVEAQRDIALNAVTTFTAITVFGLIFWLLRRRASTL